ncbi:MAG: phosphoenolpyruvate synthase [Euryarchaeota archaeon]|nr:phosphoenolpyruvate synthase [Euryarchaeota archaeon]
MRILKGIGTSSYIGVGKVKKIEIHEDVLDIKGGEIVVVPKASRDMLSHLKKAGGVITDYGGLTSHVAIVLRELKIPCIVGTGDASKILDDEMIVTVDGKTGNIYEGFIELEEESEFLELHYPSTNIKVNLNVPEIAAKVAPLADGVGSIRIENTIIHTGKHPSILLEEGKLTETIEGGVRDIVDTFYPKPVWFRTFDIPTDELIHLEGGDCEPEEHNPLLGLRAINKDLRDIKILKAEFQAVKNILEEGYYNLGLKIPFIRDISEYVKAKQILREVGLRPHKDLSVGASIETPSAVFTLDEFINEGIDFASIGMSDLTMCSLAIDRRGVKVAKHFNVMHFAVLKMVKMIIEKCNQYGIESCICGYAASDPRIVKKLVEFGISSISTNPDQILKMRKFVENVENDIIMKGFRKT